MDVLSLSEAVKSQNNIYQVNISKYGSILNYYKEIFGENEKIGLKEEIENTLTNSRDIEEKMKTFNIFWDGNEANKSFDFYKKEIIEISMKSSEISDNINKNKQNILDNDNSLNDLTTKYDMELKNKILEIEKVKKDLEIYRDQVVGGSLFKTFKVKAKHSDRTSLFYSLLGIVFLFLSAYYLKDIIKENSPNYFISSSISIILFTAAFICSSNGKIFRKLAEEYGHKATLLESFVGYREQFKTALNDNDGNEYNEFFKEVMEAVKVNPSTRIDKLLHFKWPFEKILDTTSEQIKNASAKITDVIKELP